MSDKQRRWILGSVLVVMLLAALCVSGGKYPPVMFKVTGVDVQHSRLTLEPYLMPKFQAEWVDGVAYEPQAHQVMHCIPDVSVYPAPPGQQPHLLLHCKGLDGKTIGDFHIHSVEFVPEQP